MAGCRRRSPRCRCISVTSAAAGGRLTPRSRRPPVPGSCWRTRRTRSRRGSAVGPTGWDGSRVTFPGVAGGADLVYDVTTSALKESLVLAQAPVGRFSMTFSLQTGGLSAVQRQDGSIAFVGNDGSRAYFVMPAPYMFDSHDDAASPVGKMLSDKVTQTVSQQGSTATITLRADAAWLADPARVIVAVDP